MNGEPLVESKEKQLADAFRKMADRIEHNAGSEFGGACLIVPPFNGGDPIEFLLLGPKPDLAQFYSTIQTRIQMVLQEIQEKQRIATNMGFR